ncbi:hypothetical protein Kpol_1050p53 [Vanderwaltozyma polyspora DSM 70294]|uniref:Uncharacterized protein n=1 Tax=Vanderwaltozyma polyspora (strain ATCC 22028 / DSM 70294 / BCRC 21397 / CBS 2163 / NBRC 10782 / NRRL Y-8283 / UCD 57-17) TaxID=436907 RepID=A7TEV0_VANPO|nr:uncharacterized protein Kpol_1050p53 [Vanderwaltozyma polyspora DSM 70294]EDO19196.1 hypothetical protein Kpol_1050p53 [Vanderwaltozyma polyspora DSM 70294]
MSSFVPTKSYNAGFTTEYRAYMKRDDNDSSSSSASKTSSNKSATSSCGGDGKCRYPSDHSYSTTVGVAVGVPVAVVVFLLAAILIIVYKRNKKEAEEDNDPDFQGDIEYIPHMGPNMGSFPMSSSQSGDSFELKDDQYRDTYFMPPPQQNQYARATSFGGGGIDNYGHLDPFQVPHGVDSNTLRDFARSVDGPSIGGYHVASSSKNTSQISLTNEQPTNVFMSQGDINSVEPGKFAQSRDALLSGEYEEENNFPSTNHDQSMVSNIRDSPVKSVVGEATRFYGDDESGYDVEESKIQDTTIERSQSSQHEFDFETSEDKMEGEDDEDNKVYAVDPEDENVQRLKSIYQVYLDRNETVKQNQQQNVMEPKNDILPDSKSAEIMKTDDHTGGPEANFDVVDNIELRDNSEIEHRKSQSINHLTTGNEVESIGQGSSMHHRAVSSIYSELPTHAARQSVVRNDIQAAMSNEPYPSNIQYGNEPQNYAQNNNNLQYVDQHQQLQQEPVYNHHPQAEYYNNSQPQLGVAEQGYYVQPNQAYQASIYSQQQQQQQPNMMYQNPQEIQYKHPQHLENISELPTPSRLAHSESVHSLTSFNGRTKPQQFPRLQAARLNGSALNPMDHPEMFYKQNDGQYTMYQQNAQGFTSAENIQNVTQPHQLRASIVMTNPTSLSLPASYKPAGSFRNINASNSRNNSLTVQNNPYQQQMGNSRVSGLLDYSDVVQPPGVSGIIPHSSSHDDLRKQLGTSNNYQMDL